jgi:ElaB/YqjD/DUF883 family membrane-anchored ribosome-binding protein
MRAATAVHPEGSFKNSGSKQAEKGFKNRINGKESRASRRKEHAVSETDYYVDLHQWPRRHV